MKRVFLLLTIMMAWLNAGAQQTQVVFGAITDEASKVPLV